eukprot:766360-Hanusia_phi.AAC.5
MLMSSGSSRSACSPANSTFTSKQSFEMLKRSTRISTNMLRSESTPCPASFVSTSLRGSSNFSLACKNHTHSMAMGAT